MFKAPNTSEKPFTGKPVDATMVTFIKRHLWAYRLILVGLPSIGLYFYPDVFTIIPLALLPALIGALYSPSRERYKNNSRAKAAIDWYDGVIWIWRGFPPESDGKSGQVATDQTKENSTAGDLGDCK